MGSETVLRSPSLVATANNRNLHRIVLQAVEGGVMAFAFAEEHSPFAEQDYFLGDWSAAKEFAANQWGVALDAWTTTAERPDG